MAETTDNDGFDGEDDIFGGDQSGGGRERKGESLDEILRDGSGGDREDRSIANIHTGSKVEHQKAYMAPPPEGAPPPADPIVEPDVYNPGDPPPPIDPIDVEQQAGGSYQPEERPLDFEFRGRAPDEEEAVVDEAPLEEEEERRRDAEGVDEDREELLLTPDDDDPEPTTPTEVDDTPGTPLANDSVLDEDDLSGGSDATGSRAVTQPLVIDFGDDGAGAVQLEIPDGLRELNVGQGGTPLTFSLSEGGTQIQAVDGDGGPVFTVTLNEDDGAYSYTFELQGAIDHGDLEQVNLPIGISVTDADGDKAVGEFNVGIVDDAPVAVDDETQTIEEGAGTVGTDNGADNLLANDELGADGALIFQFTYTDENGDEQTARAGETVDTEHGTLTVNGDGSWSFEADANADHSNGEPLIDGFTYSIVDADGDTSSAVQNISITDDGPQIGFPPLDDDPDGRGDAATLFEDDIAGANASVTQPLNIDFGADGEGSVALSIPQELEDMGLSVDGQTVDFTLSDDGQTIVATAGGEPVFTMSLSEEGGEFSYTFELQGNLDHPDAGSDVLSNLPFNLTVTDDDGSTASAEININVVDDQPEAVGETTLTIDEGTGSVGSSNGGANLLANDDVGADGGEITSFTYTDENGRAQTADAGETVDTENGTLTVNGDGSWTFEADESADHSDGNVMDGFTYTVTDGDGDTSQATQKIQITDDGPEIPPNAPPGGDGGPDLGRADLVVDEDNMGSATQAIEVDFGADGFGSAALSVPQELEDMNITSDGEAVSYSVSDDGQTITAEAGGAPVFTVTLNEDGGQLSYTVDLQGNVDHAADGAGDDLMSNLPVTLTVTDGDGTRTSTNLEIGITDDTPEASDDKTVSLDEGGNTVGSSNGGANLLLNDDVGADGGEITSFTYTDENGRAQTADAGETVDTENGTLTVNGDGSWTFEADESADHSDGNVMDGFTYTVTDGDGDTATASQTIEIDDGGPRIGRPPGGGDGTPNADGYSVTVDEGDLGTGTADGEQALNIDFGADGEGSVSLSVPQELEGMNITSDGQAVAFTVSDDGQTITGVTPDGQAVMTISLDRTDGDYSYNVELSGNIDHAGSGEDILSDIPVTLTVTDGDGDSASATLEVNVVDDAPQAVDDGTFDVQDGGQIIGSEAEHDNLLANDDVGADGAEVTSITYTDENGHEQTAAVREDGVTVDTEQGSLTVNQDGTWSFESDDRIESADGSPVMDNFSYTITDGDGDTSSANVSINVSDGTVEPPEVVAGDAIGYEDQPIPLNIDVSMVDTDGSESVSITINDIPDGAVLHDANGNEVEVSDGSVNVSMDDLDGLTITPPTDSDIDFDLGVSVTTTEAATGETATVETSFTVEVDAVVDETTVSVSYDAKMINPEPSPDPDPVTIDASNFGDTDSGFKVVGRDIDGEVDADNVVASGGSLGIGGAAVGDVVPNQIGHNPESGEAEGLIVEFDNDVTQVDFNVSRLFENEGDNRGSSGDEQGKVILYRDGEVVGEVDFTADSGNTGSYTVQADDGGPFDAIEFTATDYSDDNADQTGDSSDYFVDQISFTPAPDDGGGVPYCEVNVNVDATFGDYQDGSENHFIVVEVPEGWEPQGEFTQVDASDYGDGSGTFIAVPVAAEDLQASGGSTSVPVTFTAPVPDADGTVNLKVFAVAQDVNIDGTVGDGEITLDNNNTMSQASIDVEHKDMTVETPELGVSDAQGYEDNAMALDIDANLTDTDGSETLSVTISDIPEGAVLKDGDGNEISVNEGTASLSQDDLDGLNITPPTDSDVDFDLKVSVTSTEQSTGETSTVEQSFTVEVDAVADDVGVSAEIKATVTPGEEGEAQEITIGADNYNAADTGFTVSGRTLDSDGNLSEGSTDNISVKSDGHPTGFGVKGDASNGADSEIGYEDGKSEQVVIEFDTDVSEANVTIAWQNPNEDCRITLYRDGEPVGERTIEGGTDGVDSLGSFQADDGGSFDQIVFEATGDNSDFLVHEVTFETAPPPADSTCEVEVDVTATFGDYQDGSEEHFVFVEVPEGMSPTDENAESIEGDAENGLPEGTTFVKVPVDAEDIESGGGTVTVPVSFTGPVPDVDGWVNVEVFAGAVETNLDGTELTTENNMTLKGTSVEIETKDMTVSDPEMNVDDSSGLEDTAIPLDLNISLTDTDGSESMSITLGDIPEGATLTDGDGNEITVTDGSASLSQDDLEGLSITPPHDSDVDFDLKVEVTVTESSTGESKTYNEDVKVEVVADADAPTLNASLSVSEDDGHGTGGAGEEDSSGHGEGGKSKQGKSASGHGSKQGKDKSGSGSGHGSKQGKGKSGSGSGHGSKQGKGKSGSGSGHGSKHGKGGSGSGGKGGSKHGGGTGSGGGGSTDDGSTTYDLDIESALTDVDGSESLAITLGPVPSGVSFSAGTDNGDGTWSLESGDLQDLSMTVDANVSEDFNLPIAATSTEAENGDSETVNMNLSVELPDDHGVPVGEQPVKDDDKGSPQGNNGFGNGDQDAPGNSLDNNNAENDQDGDGHRARGGSGSGHGKGGGSKHAKGGSASGHGKGRGSKHAKGGSASGHGKDAGSGQGGQGSGQGMAAAAVEDDGDSNADIAKALNKFANQVTPENGKNFADDGPGRGNNGGGNWFDEDNNGGNADDDVFGKTAMEQKEEDDEMAAEADREEQEGGIEIPVEDNGSGNEADFEDRSLV